MPISDWSPLNPIKNLKKRRRREAIENELKIVNFPGQSLAKNELWKSVMISNIESLKRKGIQRLRWVFNLMLGSDWPANNTLVSAHA